MSLPSKAHDGDGGGGGGGLSGGRGQGEGGGRCVVYTLTHHPKESCLLTAGSQGPARVWKKTGWNREEEEEEEKEKEDS